MLALQRHLAISHHEDATREGEVDDMTAVLRQVGDHPLAC
jgi:hypothetical protein